MTKTPYRMTLTTVKTRPITTLTRAHSTDVNLKTSTSPPLEQEDPVTIVLIRKGKREVEDGNDSCPTPGSIRNEYNDRSIGDSVVRSFDTLEATLNF